MVTQSSAVLPTSINGLVFVPLHKHKTPLTPLGEGGINNEEQPTLAYGTLKNVFALLGWGTDFPWWCLHQNVQI